MIPREQCWRWQRSPSQHTEKSKQFQTSHIPIIKLFKAIFATGNFSMAVFCFKVLGSLRHVIWLFASPWFLNPLKYPLRNRMPIIFMQKKCLFLFLSPPHHVQSLFLYTLKELPLGCLFTENNLKLHLLRPNLSTNILLRYKWVFIGPRIIGVYYSKK